MSDRWDDLRRMCAEAADDKDPAAQVMRDLLAERDALAAVVRYLLDGAIIGPPYENNGKLGVSDGGCGCCSDWHEFPPEIAAVVVAALTEDPDDG